MTTFLAQMSFTWLALFPILNPPAMAPVFLALTSAIGDRERDRLALLIGAYTALFLTVVRRVCGPGLQHIDSCPSVLVRQRLTCTSRSRVLSVMRPCHRNPRAL